MKIQLVFDVSLLDQVHNYPIPGPARPLNVGSKTEWDIEVVIDC